MGERKGAYRVLVGKAEGQRPHGSPRQIWEGNFEMDLQVLRWKGKDWIVLTQHRNNWQFVVNTIMNFQIP
jgi:hypothetical protein